MEQAGLAVNFFVALFALIDPIGSAPVFAAATAGAEPHARRRIALYVCAFVAVFLAFFYITGLGLLKFFGISLPAFRIAGGVLLFILGLNMIQDDFTAMFADASESEAAGPLDWRASARRRFERLVVPFAMPFLIGPGSISAVVIYAGDSHSLTAYGAGLCAIVAVSFTLLLAFLAAGAIARVLGKIGTTIVVRVLGLILCSLAVQFMISGLEGATNGLIRHAAAHPYPS